MKSVALVLGGTSPHIELINQLKARGYYVVLLDYLKNPPARKFADRFIQESTLEKERVRVLAEESGASIVISTCIDQANSTCCYVSEKLGLPCPYSYETSLDVTDKGRMKSIFRSTGVPTSRFSIIKSLDDINDNNPNEFLKFPLVVKPVDCNSSKGVRKVDNLGQLKKYAEDALRLSRTHTAIVEEFVMGREIQVDCIASSGSVNVILTREKKKVAVVNGLELQSTGSVIPASLAESALIQVKNIAEKIAEAFRLHNTPFFYQAMVDKDDHVNVLEFAPRIGGGLSYYVLKNIAGVDVIKCAVDPFLGNSISYTKRNVTGYYSTNLLYAEGGVFDHIAGMDELRSDKSVVETFQFKEKGTEIGIGISSGTRVGAFILKADSLEELHEKEISLMSGIDILDINGKSIKKNLINDTSSIQSGL